MKTKELRQTYLDFFKAKGHKLYASDSLIPADDPSLLFTGAGMNQFKPYFLGLKKDVRRATSCQKCLRTADLDRVGKTAYHHSFFEMLGNFSFGDYFKEEAIEWGWEFVTRVMRLPEDELWVSVYQDDEEAFSFWKKKIGVPEARIVRMDAVDNFWPSNAQKDGPNGPCGPCSEIYVGKIPGKGVEIWNLVFTQFDRQSDATLLPLPQKNIDTGMGLERASAVLQKAESNFDIDLFQNIRKGLKTLLKPGFNDRAHENAVLDHIRAVVFSIADGALPSNEGRGYVIRKIIRLGTDHLNKAGAVREGSFCKLVPFVVGEMGDVYPEIAQREKTIIGIIENEERAYQESCRRAENTRQGSMSVDEYAFMLYDTHGLPINKIKEKFERDGVVFNENAFEAYLNGQREKSRKSSKITGEIFAKTNLYAFIEGLPATKFLGYETLEASRAKVLRIIQGDSIVAEIKAGEEGVLIFNETPFYAESGGQVGDLGSISGEKFSAQILDTRFLDKCIGHRVRAERGSLRVGDAVDLLVAGERRKDIMKNHTATHLLHSALHRILGAHIKQSGSLVADEYLRFDFTHFSALDADTILQIETLIRREIEKDVKLDKKVMSKDEAIRQGATAFFGEKYGDQVRVVTIGDFSKELCGGTHLNSTGEIEAFKIISEGSIQAGVRRIEAVTGRAAKEYIQKQDEEIQALCRAVGSNEKNLLTDIRESGNQVSRLRLRALQAVSKKAREGAQEALRNAQKSTGAPVFSFDLTGGDAELFKLVAEHLKSLGEPYAAVFFARQKEKVALAVAISQDLSAKGLQAGKIVKEISAIVEGNGGGRPDFAIGGGKNVFKTAEAVEAAKKIAIKTLSTGRNDL